MDDRQEQGFGDGAGGAEAAGGAGRASRLERRLSALEERQRNPEPISILRLLNTDELRRALALIERAGVTPSGEIRDPNVFGGASSEELEALEHWRKLCGEPLDHLELAEELLDRIGEAKGWRSPQALEAALLLERLKLAGESDWYITKTAKAVVALYAELEEHGAGRGGGELHPHVRGAVRRLERLKEIDRIAPGPTVPESKGRTEPVATSQGPQWAEGSLEGANEPQSDTESAQQEAAERAFTKEVPRRRSRWRGFFGL